MAKYRTPLRYPGGKQKLTPFVLELIIANGMEGCQYVEPYAGGAGVAMQLLIDGHVKNVHLNDSSYHIYAFWHSILNDTEKFCNQISKSLLNIDEWKKHREVVRHPSEHSIFDVGFSTFYLNRTNRSGVLTGGVIGGLSQEGKWKIDARFSHSELINRIELIASKKDSVFVYNKDAEDFFAENVIAFPENTFMYCDPPYFDKASGLYLNYYKPEDHERIANTIQTIDNIKWIVSYDGVENILSYYKNRKKFLYQLQYNVSKVYKGNEVFIFSDDMVIPRDSGLNYISHALKNNPHVFEARI
ncbi:DNA adenine methylase, partial [Klebsiella pneumoniae]